MISLLIKAWKFLPSHKNLQLSLVRLFQDQFLVGVSGIIFNEKDKVLLFKHTYRNIPWSLPAEYLKAKEHPMEGLAREIEEESGFFVSIDGRLDIKTDRDFARLEVSYIGTFLGGDFQASNEVEDYGFFSLQNLPIISKKQLLLIKSALEKRKQQSLVKLPPSYISPNNNLNLFEIIKNHFSV